MCLWQAMDLQHVEGGFIKNCQPGIEYLELYALTAGVLTWESHLSNRHMILHCDNMAVVHMVNNLTSSCPCCMTLLRILTLNGLIFNRKIIVHYVTSKNNRLSDVLSRGQMARFRALRPLMNQQSDLIDQCIWPLSKLWSSHP